MGCCVGSGGNLLLFVVKRVVVIFMGYCVASGGNFLWVVWGVVVICYWLLCGKWW